METYTGGPIPEKVILRKEMTQADLIKAALMI